MKKYIYILLACVAMFSSCSNDDISIRTATNFKINPATVIAPFTWEWTPGDLESFNTNYQLRIRLLIYNSEGLLQAEDTQYFSNYAVTMNSSLDLPAGDYNAIVITDLAGQTSNAVKEFWTLSEYERLADTHIDDVGYIGGQEKILGITNQSFSVTNESQNEISINVQPVGALFFVYIRNIHTFDFATRYSLVCAKTAEQCIFNTDGSYSIVAKNNNGSYDWRICYTDPADHLDADHVYGYYYVLPASNLNLKFQYNTESTEHEDITPVMTINPQAGEEWMFVLDLQDPEYGGGVTYNYGIANDATNASAPQKVKGMSTIGTNQQISTNPRNYLKYIR